MEFSSVQDNTTPLGPDDHKHKIEKGRYESDPGIGKGMTEVVDAVSSVATEGVAGSEVGVCALFSRSNFSSLVQPHPRVEMSSWVRTIGWEDPLVCPASSIESQSWTCHQFRVHDAALPTLASLGSTVRLVRFPESFRH